MPASFHETYKAENLIPDENPRYCEISGVLTPILLSDFSQLTDFGYNRMKL
jgi:hypothetical protein